MANTTPTQPDLPDVGTTWANGIGPVEGDKLTIATGNVSPLTRTHIWSNEPVTEPLPLAVMDNAVGVGE